MSPTALPETETDMAVARIVRFFEQLTPQSVDAIGSIYAPDARL